MAREFDSPWKEALEHYLESTMQLLFPDVNAAIDWSKGYESMDKELLEIVREAELGATIADKLFRVHLLDGADVWLLVHIEIQAQRDAGFGQRMFTYAYRIVDRYNSDVVSLAILSDSDPPCLPAEYVRERFGTGFRFRFRGAKLLDWMGRLDELERDPRPIAAVLLAHLQSLQTHGKPHLRYASKKRLLIGLYQRGLQPEDCRQLFRLVDWLLDLTDELQVQLRNEIHAYEQEHKMPYVTSFERLAREEGLEKGRQEGQREGLLEALDMSLEVRFGNDGTFFARELRSITNIETLRRIQRKVLLPDSTLDDLRSMLN